MKAEQIYTKCLSQASYYIESEGEVAIVDPLRDYQTYIEKANSNGAKIKYIFETHFHADFVSGHIDLAKKTGAKIVFGPTTQTNYPVHVAQDEEVLQLGKIKIKVLHTPGHTTESSCYLLIDEYGKDFCIFSGDTLFVGDVGRPDLLDGIISKEELAGMMYNSLNTKIKPLADDVIVYPAHGAGSACGKNLGKETFSTIGEQRKNNYALQSMSEKDFIKIVTDGIAPAPAYFFKDAKLNKQGYASFDDVLNKAERALTIQQFEEEIKNGATIIDTRIPDFFELGFIPSSYNFGLNGQYAIWAATILDIAQPIIIVAKHGTEKESIERLTRVGFDTILGFLDGGFDAWKNADKKIDMVISISAEEFALDVKHNSNAKTIDVRKPNEFETKHVVDASNIQLSELANKMNELEKSTEYLVHCAGGYRSMIAASMLKANGFNYIKNVWGGFEKIKDEKVKLVASKTA